jgi:DNA-binding transcriptional ArsR family regulator
MNDIKSSLGYNIPCWLRISWIGITPDPDELIPKGEIISLRSPIRWGRNSPRIPDRWVYYLFLSGYSIQDMLRTLHLKDEWNLSHRLDKLEEAGWITSRQRKRWKTSIYSSKGEPPIKKPRNPELYRKINHLIRKGDYSISELAKLTSAPRGTVTRYASLWRSRNPGYYRKVEWDDEGF